MLSRLGFTFAVGGIPRISSTEGVVAGGVCGEGRKTGRGMRSGRGNMRRRAEEGERLLAKAFVLGICFRPVWHYVYHLRSAWWQREICVGGGQKRVV